MLLQLTPMFVRRSLAYNDDWGPADFLTKERLEEQ